MVLDVDVFAIIDAHFCRIICDAVRIAGAQFNVGRKHAVVADNDAFPRFGHGKMSCFYRSPVPDFDRAIVIFKIKITAVKTAIAANLEFVVAASHENAHIEQQRAGHNFDEIIVAFYVEYTIRQYAVIANGIAIAAHRILIFQFDVPDFGLDIQYLLVVFESLFQ
jgi:hypothetical protein